MMVKKTNVVSLSDGKTNRRRCWNWKCCVENNDEQQHNQIKEEIEKEEGAEPIVTVSKPKRKPLVKKNKVVEEHIVSAPEQHAKRVLVQHAERVLEPPRVVEPPRAVEPVSEPEATPEKKIKTVKLFKCDLCGKENLTKRTLRYSHPANCPGKKVDRNEIPVKKQATQKKKATPPPRSDNVLNIPEEIIQNEKSKRLSNIRET